MLYNHDYVNIETLGPNWLENQAEKTRAEIETCPDSLRAFISIESACNHVSQEISKLIAETQNKVRNKEEFNSEIKSILMSIANRHQT